SRHGCSSRRLSTASRSRSSTGSPSTSKPTTNRVSPRGQPRLLTSSTRQIPGQAALRRDDIQSRQLGAQGGRVAEPLARRAPAKPVGVEENERAAVRAGPGDILSPAPEPAPEGAVLVPVDEGEVAAGVQGLGDLEIDRGEQAVHQHEVIDAVLVDLAIEHPRIADLQVALQESDG